MFPLGIALCFLFVFPAYSRLRVKGYGPWPFVLPAAALYLVFAALGLFLDAAWYGVSVIPPACLFAVARLIPACSGAPGEALIQIEFHCPECGKSVRFPRSAEGRAVLCPECGELVRVEDENALPQSDEAVAIDRGDAEASGEFATVGKYLNSAQAELARQKLAAAGVAAFLPDSTASHAYPVLEWASGGSRLMVNTVDRDRALDILNLSPEETSIPRDFVVPPGPPEPIRDDRLAHTVLCVIVFLFLFPFILMRLWVWTVPLLFVEAVQEGIVSQSLSFGAAFRATAVLSLIFVGIAFFWESGRSKRE
ncbi:MAG: zinc ribbon domain-containing protein [Kiritimatiellia bacterium]|jgi:uncharacterized Zn finger protein (UPF0148 family)|nr:zinc ribbon domain-containing protein [Kiritimatiellia bacterium]MDP6631784.1 zinc ribbon domain-containing protein [Kiritimatiellia bacterium]MDP6810459.1 zinc ribbon domain-containing protein [Kiritimatiellia bacterium]MDP7024520.1 zinc ribbon domain-containing protein [Kiritimatiellia bacterium]